MRLPRGRGTQFRRWATERLKEYLVKGFRMDDERLRNPPVEGTGIPDYFDELLERIRDIRGSERRVYLRVRENFRARGRLEPCATGDERLLPGDPEQVALRRDRTDRSRDHQIACRPFAGQHGADGLEGRCRSQGRHHDREELSRKGRDPRTEPDRHDVARFRGGSGATKTTDLPLLLQGLLEVAPGGSDVGKHRIHFSIDLPDQLLTVHRQERNDVL